MRRAPSSTLLTLMDDDVVVVTPGLQTAGLLLRYAFNAGSGQVLTDLSPNGYHARLGSTTGADADDPNWVPEGLQFTRATKDYCRADGVPDTNWLGDLTLMVVARTDVGSDRHTWLSKCSTNAGANDNPITFRQAIAGNPAWIEASRANAAGYWNWYGQSVVYGTFQCYSAVCPADVLSAPTFYLNRDAMTGHDGAGSTPTVGPPTGTNQPLMIGLRIDNAGPVDGYMCYLLVYNRALSAGEIDANYTWLKGVLAPRGVVLP